MPVTGTPDTDDYGTSFVLWDNLWGTNYVMWWPMGAPNSTYADSLARRDSAEDFSRLNARRCTAKAWIFIPAYCSAIP